MKDDKIFVFSHSVNREYEGKGLVPCIPYLVHLVPQHSLAEGQPHPPTIICYDRKIETNPAQFSTVKHIVGGTSDQCPYFVF